MATNITPATVTHQQTLDIAHYLTTDTMEHLHQCGTDTPGEWLTVALESEHRDEVLQAAELAGFNVIE